MLAKKALVAGVPTAISFGCAEVEGKMGLLYEFVNARSLAQIFAADPDSIDAYIESYVALVKCIHALDRTAFADFPLVDAAEKLRSKANSLAELLPEQTAAELRHRLEALQGENVLLHLDIQPGNVMATDEGLIFIDMDTMGKGPAVLDLANLYRTLVGYEKLLPGAPKRLLGIEPAVCLRLWKRFRERFYQGESKAFLDRQEEICRHVSMVNISSKMCRTEPGSEAEQRALALLKQVVCTV